ncbi:MAG TPA: ABC transporter permease, partial [Pyrinomonadaceae bacterium]|nr:ABC transporter permease [Pyrinomonadaceae bacterium]
MPFELFLALRYLRSRKKRKLARATALAAVVGIGIGVGALIVALALANGFRDEMRDKILRGTAHLTIMRTDGQTMQDYNEVAARVRRISGVVSAAGTTYDGA